jgi:mannitol/fructose-specific phosphotransferase system IIA component (Ntr-type)
MILSLCVVILLYTLMVLVTSGVLEDEQLNNTLTPISDGAFVTMGSWGQLALGFAAVLAFLTTANAGIMTSARSLVPLSRDKLFPLIFGRIHRRFGTPWNALILTGALVLGALFLRLKILIEAASMVVILTQMLACVSVIILRESRLQNYRPRFHAPLYPWLQIGGILGLVLLVVEAGLHALLICAIFIVAGFLAYWFYGRLRGYREYALLHLIESITDKKLTNHLLESELREIIRERDGLEKDRFDDLVERAVVVDFDQRADHRELFRQAAVLLSKPLLLPRAQLLDLLIHRETESSTVISPTIAIPHIVVSGQNRFALLLARCKKGFYFSEASPDIKAVFMLAGTKDERNFHLVSLAAIAQIVQEDDFECKWLTARGVEALRDLVLLGKRRR